MAVILMTVALLMVVSLASYHADDPAWPLGNWTNEPVRNIVGIAGAFCAEILLQLFGYAAWAVPPLLLLLGWEVFWRRSGRVLSRLGGSALLVVSAAASLHLAIDEQSGAWARDAGGWFGYGFAHVLERLLNRWGALIASLAAVVISLLVVTRASIVDALRMLWSRCAALARNLWLSWVRHREARRKELLRLEVARRQRERRAAAAAVTEESEPAVEPHAAAPIPMAATDAEAEPAAETRAAAAAAARRTARASARARGPAEGQPQFDFGDTPPRYTPPPLSLLNPPQHEVQVDEKELVETARIITEKCREFDVTGQVIAIQPGPVVTVFEFKPDAGVKYSKIVTLADDLCLAIEAESIRIDRIAGKSTVGIEVPNKKRETISLRELLASERFQKSTAPLTIALGKEINGEPYYADLARMPHLLVAGSTGSGKSVCMNAVLTSFLYKSSPEEVKFIMIDPKRLELGVYENIPHLLTPLVTETKKAANALRWAVLEMERRYKQLAEAGVRGIDQYNVVVKREHEEKAAAAEGALQARTSSSAERGEGGAAAEPAARESTPPTGARVSAAGGEALRPLPYIVILVDELADLMMTTGVEVEEAITRLAQMARAVGIHLILSTQRPSVDIITGVIKANFPCRVAMRVSSKVDSRTILDSNGAEQLLGQGDMLFIPPGSARLIRLHGPLVTEVEATRIVTFLKKQAKPQYDESVTRDDPQAAAGGAQARDEEVDPAYDQAVRLAVQMGQISVSHIQRRLKLGYARAARLVDMMEQNGIVGPADGSKPREVLVEPEFLERLDQMRAERT